jgi:stage III sporulation protein AG
MKKKSVYYVGILMAIVIIVVGMFSSNNDNSMKTTSNGEHLTTNEAEKLAVILSRIQNVGEVELYFYANGQTPKDTEKKSSSLDNYFSWSSTAGQESEQISGVLVVAEGADDIAIQNELVNTLTKVLEIPAHRIVVMPMEKRGEMK